VSDTSLIDFLAVHSTAAVVTVAVCVFISFCLIARLWILFSRDSIARKIVWTLLLFVPLLGWIFYGAFYRPPAYAPGGHVEYGQAASSGMHWFRRWPSLIMARERSNHALQLTAYLYGVWLFV
jgi:hypothetical protein